MATAVKNRINEKGLLKLKNTEKQIITKLINGNTSNKISKTKEEIIMKNFPLAVYIAKKYMRSGVAIEDLIQVAALGLIKAVCKFKAEKKVKFATYVAPTIEGEIRHFLRDSYFSVKTSRKYIELNGTIQKYRENFMLKNGREATDEEVSMALGIKKQEVEKTNQLVSSYFTLSLDAPIQTYLKGGESTLSRLEDLVGHESQVEKMLEVEGLNEALSTLTVREQSIVKDHFFREIKQDELSKKYKITQAQISRILKASCEKMKLVLV